MVSVSVILRLILKITRNVLTVEIRFAVIISEQSKKF